MKYPFSFVAYTTSLLTCKVEKVTMEAKIQRQILDYLERAQVLHWRLNLSAIHGRKGNFKGLIGFPDIFGILPNTYGKVFFVEVKAPKGKLSEGQLEFHKRLRNANCLVIVATKLEEVSYFIDSHLRTPEE